MGRALHRNGGNALLSEAIAAVTKAHESRIVDRNE